MFFINLSEYMYGVIENIVSDIVRATIKNPKETAFMMKFMLSAKKANAKRIRYENEGKHIPPFLIASITGSCNLFCKGCYARANASCGENKDRKQLSDRKWDDIFLQAESLGISFIILAGGEPMVRKEVIMHAAAHKNIIFPIFTNGTMIDDSDYKLLGANRNLIPVLSIEGDKEQTDDRRGKGTYDIIMNAMDTLNAKGLLFGASVTVTTENIHHVTEDTFIQDLYQKGCKIIFFIEYVPVDQSTAYLAPGNAEREILSEKQIYLREKYNNMLFLSFPGDEKQTGGCLAAGRGFFHINVDGSAEPCPFSPYSDTNVNDCTLMEVLSSPLFNKLADSGMLLGEHDGGCLLFERENEVKSMLRHKEKA